MVNKQSFCSLFVILARNMPVGLILRRGPSKWVQAILWNTKSDTFEYGQWFHGRIYERRCDLSPNGTKFIYFASKFNRRTLKDKEYTYAWTAISQPPKLTALALWPKGDCWHGGGLFEDDHTVLLNHKPEMAIHHKNHKPVGLIINSNPDASGEDWPIYTKRLERDGWKLIQSGEYLEKPNKWISDKPYVWRKYNRARTYAILMQTTEIDFKIPGGPYVLDFYLIKNNKEEKLHLGRASWADWDQQNRLVLAQEGKLFEIEFQFTKEKIEYKLLADLTNLTPPDTRQNVTKVRNPKGLIEC